MESTEQERSPVEIKERSPIEISNISSLEKLNRTDLLTLARDLNVQGHQRMKKQELIYKIMEAQAEAQGLHFATGILEILPEGYGFLRGKSYLPGNGDIYVSMSQIKRFDLRMGDIVSGQVRPPKNGEKYYGLVKVQAVNTQDPDQSRRRPHFEDLTPVFPDKRFDLEVSKDDLSTRIIDLFCPIGQGQRGLIVAPPKAGQDHSAQEDCQRRRHQSSRHRADRPPDRRAPRRSHRHGALD